MKPRRSTSAPFVVGLVVLSLFLAGLVGVFLREDEARRSETEGQRAALEAYASATLRRALEDEWRLGVALMDSALAEPLLDDSRLLLVSDGTPLLPRRARGTTAGVVVAMNALLATTVDDPDDSPPAERRRFVTGLARALATSNKPEIESNVRGLLNHRRQFRLGPVDDLSTVLAMIELLQTRSKPTQVLMERVLRDGFTPQEAGLQRHVLELSERLSADELTRVCAIVERQSQRALVQVNDFVARCAAMVGPTGAQVADAPPGLSVQQGFVLRGGPEVRGVAVAIPTLLDAQQTSMRERGLIEETDTLELSSSEGLVDSLLVSVESPRWLEATRQRRSALQLKLVLLAVAFLLGVGLVMLAFTVQRREQALLDTRNELVATVSHELRTPLASLRVMAETLERKTSGVAEAKDWPQRIVAEVDGLSALVENILSFNRLERGRDVLHRQPWALDEVRAWLEADAPEVLSTVQGTSGLTLEADPTWMKVVFLNLLRNARKYNERTPVTFLVDAKRDGGSVVIDVKDNGIGIERAQWESVFEAFHRLRDARGRGGGGSGLGLAVVRRVVEGHGGTVQVVDSSGEGTTFRLVLPRRHIS